MSFRRALQRIAVAMLALCMTGGIEAADDAGTLDGDSQNLKREILELDRDLRVLEERSLYPAPARLTVFVSMDLGTFFKLEKVQLDIDGTEVTQHQYGEGETQALIKGGMQQLYEGNVPSGAHELTAVFTGRGPHDFAVRRAVSIRFDQFVDLYGRDPRPRLVELHVRDGEDLQQPDFVATIWP